MKFNAIFIEYIILCIKETINMDIQQKHNTIYIVYGMVHQRDNKHEYSSGIQCNIYLINDIVYQ